jgi:hypothetical protein
MMWPVDEAPLELIGTLEQVMALSCKVRSNTFGILMTETRHNQPVALAPISTIQFSQLAFLR